MAPNRDLCFPVSDCSRSRRVCPKWRPNSYNEGPKGAWGQRERVRETPNLILVLNWPKQTFLVSAFFHSSQGRLLACSQLLYAYKYTQWSRLCHWHSKIALSTTTLPFNLFSLSHTQSCYDLSLSLSLSLSFPDLLPWGTKGDLIAHWASCHLGRMRRRTERETKVPSFPPWTMEQRMKFLQGNFRSALILANRFHSLTFFFFLSLV